MTENRFFTWVWRFNALVIALASLLFIGIILWELTRDWRRSAFPTAATEVLNVPAEMSDAEQAQPETEETARFGTPDDTGPAGIYALPLFVEQKYRNRGISKETGGNRADYLIVDTTDQSQSWLFGAGSRLITDTRALWYGHPSVPRRFLGHVLHVIDTDTNQDGRLSRADLGRLLHVSPDWRRVTLLAQGITHTLELRVTLSDSFDVIYTSPDGAYLRRYSLPDAALEVEIKLDERP